MRLYDNYKKYNQYETLLNLLVLLLLFVLSTFAIKNYFTPFFTIIILIFMCKPIYNGLKRINIKNEICGALTLLIINILLFFFVFYFSNSIIGIFQKIYTDHLDEIKKIVESIELILRIDIENILKNKMNIFSSTTLKNSVSITGKSILSYIIANISVYFILVDKNKILKLLNRLLPKNMIRTIRIKKNNFSEVIKVEIILLIICMIITIIGFKILRVPSSVFLGVICGILDILPYVGTIIVFIPIIIYNIVMKEYLLVIGLIALYLLVQVIREIMELKFLSSKLDIHPLLVMLSMYIGAEVFGIIGIFVGPIYCLVAKDIILQETI